MIGIRKCGLRRKDWLRERWRRFASVEASSFFECGIKAVHENEKKSLAGIHLNKWHEFFVRETVFDDQWQSSPCPYDPREAQELFSNPFRRKALAKWIAKQSLGNVEFTLYKQNLSTSEALDILGLWTRNKESSNSFMVSGKKDKASISLQRVICSKQQCLDFLNAQEWFLPSHFSKEASLKLSSFHPTNRVLQYGLHEGNEFGIALRYVKREEREEWLRRLALASEEGFYNYFGPQRFGNHKNNHLIGEGLLSEDFDAVINELVRTDNFKRRNSHIKNLFYQFHQKNDPSIHKFIPTGMQQHKTIFQNLSFGADVSHAVRVGLTDDERNFYLHSFFSYLWNDVVSQRERDFPLSLSHPLSSPLLSSPVLEGDLYYPSLKREDTNILDTLASKEGLNYEPPKVKRLTKEESSFICDVYRQNLKLDKAHQILQENNLPSKFDIVFPIYGSKILLPANQYGQILEDHIHQKNNLKKSKLERVSGAYRYLLSAPKNVFTSFQTVLGRPHESADWLRHSPYMARDAFPREEEREGEIEDETGGAEREEGRGEEIDKGTGERAKVFKPYGLVSSSHSHEGAVLHFNLPSSSYATTLLRHVMQKSFEEILIKKKQ